MATLNIEGQSVQVDDSFLKLSPDQQNATVDEIAKTLKPQAPVTASGLAKQLGVGAAQGAIGLAGAPADLGQLAAQGYDKLRGTNYADTLKPLTDKYGSQNIQKTVEGYTGDFRKPQNRAEEIAQTVGNYAPLVASGPGGIARKVLTNVVAPAAGEEIAKEAAKGTGLEPYAPIVGAVVGGGIGSKIGDAVAGTKAAIANTQADAIQGAAKNQYKDLTATNLGIPIPDIGTKTGLETLSAEIKAKLNSEGIRPSNASGIHSALEELKTPATPGLPDVVDLVAARQSMKNLLGSPDASKAGAKIAIDRIEKEINDLSPGTMAQLKQADQNYAGFKANEALDKRLARADLRAAGEHSGMNLGNKIRQNVTNYLTSSEARYLSDANKASLEKIVRGSLPQNTVRTISNLLGGGGGLGSTLLGATGAIGGTQAGHPELALAPVAGFGLRSLANRMTVRQAQKAAAEIRNRTPYGQQQLQRSQVSPTSPLGQAIMRAIIARQSGILG